MSQLPTVFIVDDNIEVTDSLQWLFKSLGYSVEIYSSASSFLRAYDVDRPGCLVADVRMPGISGLEMQEELCARNVIIPIIFITGHGDIPMAVRAMKGGAVDFLTKPINKQMLLEAINKSIKLDAQNRQRGLKEKLVRTNFDSLTPRERQVMELMVVGRSNKVIAQELGISVSTVELHRSKVMRKMGVEKIAELVNVAFMLGLLDKA